MNEEFYDLLKKLKKYNSYWEISIESVILLNGQVFYCRDHTDEGLCGKGITSKAYGNPEEAMKNALKRCRCKHEKKTIVREDKITMFYECPECEHDWIEWKKPRKKK